MVEPISLSLGAVVAALVSKASERAADDTVDVGAGLLRRFVSKLRERFTGDRDEPVRVALARVEDAPDSPSRQRQLADLIDARTRDDSELAALLEALIAEARDSGLAVQAIAQTARGSQNVQIADSSGVQVSYGSQSGRGSGC